MSGKRPRHDDEQARSDGNNPLVRKQNKGRIRGSVAVEAKEKLLSLMMSLLPKLVGMESEGFDIYDAMIQLENEVRKLLERLRPEHCACKIRCCANQMDNSASRSLQLEFINKLTLPSFTMENVKGEDSSVPSIALVDAQTKQIVKSGPESSMNFEMVLLQGHFKGNDDSNWTSIQFSNHIVREREGKQPLLIGDVSLTLKEGTAEVRELKITDNSSWTWNREFRLAARVRDGYFDGMRIKEAITEPFRVKENRGKPYQKKHPPSLDDEVWSLEEIGRDGNIHKRLKGENINTVKDFLIKLHADTQGLQNILGFRNNDKRWEVIKKHAEECDLGSETYVYYSKAEWGKGVVFNIVGAVKGFLFEERFIPINELPDIQKVKMQQMIKVAYENWGEVVLYADGAILGSSSNVVVDCFPCGSTRLENPTNICSSSRHSSGPPLHQPSVLLSPVMGSPDNNILSDNVGMESVNYSDLLLYEDTRHHIDLDGILLAGQEFQPHQVNNTSSFFNVSMQSVAANDKAHQIWKTLITVLKFSILIVPLKDVDA